MDFDNTLLNFDNSSAEHDDRDSTVTIGSFAYVGLSGITNFTNDNTQNVTLYDSTNGDIYVINLSVVSPFSVISVTYSN